MNLSYEKNYPNQNGELFNAFLNNRRESKTESERELKKTCRDQFVKVLALKGF
jgi:hypothetical protein